MNILQNQMIRKVDVRRPWFYSYGQILVQSNEMMTRCFLSFPLRFQREVFAVVSIEILFCHSQSFLRNRFFPSRTIGYANPGNSCHDERRKNAIVREVVSSAHPTSFFLPSQSIQTPVFSKNFPPKVSFPQTKTKPPLLIIDYDNLIGLHVM